MCLGLFSLGLEWKLTFSSHVTTAEFSKFAGIFTASSFRIWNSSTGLLSSPLALFIVMLSKAHLTLHSRMSGSRSMIKWVSSSHQVPKYWSFSFSISPSDEYSWLISFRMDWLDQLAVQGTLQHHSSSISSSVLSFLYSPTLTSIRDHWKNHNFGWFGS